MFRHKIFSIVKCLQMQMISGKIIVFPVFDCILENSLKNILQCLEQRKMKIKENLETYCKVQTHHRNPPIINSKPASQQTRKPTNPANPQTHKSSKPTNPPSQHVRAQVPPRRPQSRAHHQLPRRVRIKGGFDRRALRSELESHRAAINHEPHRTALNHELTDPSPATQNRHTYQQPITRSGKKKKKTETQICSCFNGFLYERSRGVVCCARSAPEGLLCEIARGGDGAVQERKREQEGGGVRGCNILKNGLRKIFP